VRRDKDAADVFRHLAEVVERPVLRDLVHQRLAVEPAFPRHRLEVRVHEGQVPVPHDVAVGHGEEGSIPDEQPADDADGTGGAMVVTVEFRSGGPFR